MLIQDVKRSNLRLQQKPEGVVSSKLRRLTSKKERLSNKKRGDLGIKTDHQLKTGNTWDVALRFKYR